MQHYVTIDKINDDIRGSFVQLLTLTIMRFQGFRIADRTRPRRGGRGRRQRDSWARSRRR